MPALGNHAHERVGDRIHHAGNEKHAARSGGGVEAARSGRRADGQHGEDDSEDLQLYRTDTVRSSCSPIFNEAFCFAVKDRSQPVFLTVYDEDPESADDVIGKIELDCERVQEGEARQKAQWEPIKKVKRRVSASSQVFYA